MNILFVKGLPGQKMPKAGLPRTYITDAEPIAVEDCHYYRQAIKDGDLVELSATEWADYQAGRNNSEALAVKIVAKTAA